MFWWIVVGWVSFSVGFAFGFGLGRSFERVNPQASFPDDDDPDDGE